MAYTHQGAREGIAGVTRGPTYPGRAVALADRPETGPEQGKTG